MEKAKAMRRGQGDEATIRQTAAVLAAARDRQRERLQELLAPLTEASARARQLFEAQARALGAVTTAPLAAWQALLADLGRR